MVRSLRSGLMATAVPTMDSMGTSLAESEYAVQRERSKPSMVASAATACFLPGPCRISPTSRPVNLPSLTSATVPSAPVNPNRRASTCASCTGVAVTNHTCWPAAKCISANWVVPGYARRASEASTISSHSSTSSSTLRPLTNSSACARPAATSRAFSLPETRNLSCFHAIGTISDSRK